MFNLVGLFECYYGARQHKRGNQAALRRQMGEQLKQLKNENFRIQVDVSGMDAGSTAEPQMNGSWVLSSPERQDRI